MEFPKHPFRTHGGAAVPHHKNTWDIPSSTMPPPEKVILPMQQHIGAPCIPTVKKGDHVYVGTVVGDSDAYVSAPVHASVSGTVTEITQVMLTGGQMTQAVVVESDGKMEKDPAIAPPPPIPTKEELAKASAKAGLYLPIEEVQQTSDKVMRVQTLQPDVKNKYIKFNRRHKRLLEQLTQFPMGAHDDGPDALEGARSIAKKVKRFRILDRAEFGI